MARDGKPLNPNQVVAMRLHEARTASGMTQQDAVDGLAALGVTWSPATYSAAEASRDPSKVGRRFSADELIAFARLFGPPVVWFMFPTDSTPLRASDEGNSPELPRASLVKVLTGSVKTWEQALESRLASEIDNLDRWIDNLGELVAALGRARDQQTPLPREKSGAEQITDFLTSIPNEYEKYAGELGKRRFERDDRELTKRVREDAKEEITRLLRAENQTDRDEWQRELADVLYIYQGVISNDPEKALAYVDELREEMQREQEKGTGA